MDKKTLTPIMTVGGVIAATSFLLVLINVFSDDGSLPEQTVLPQDSPPTLSPPPTAHVSVMQLAEIAKEVPLEEPPKEDKPDIAQLVSDLAAPLRYVKVVPDGPRVEEEQKPSASYTITVATLPPDMEDLFGMHEYTFETGNDFSDMVEVCQAVTEGPQQPRVELARSQVVLEELYAISGLIGLAARLGDTVEVYVRGYADGQTADWARPLLEGQYAYHAIDVHPPPASDSREPPIFLQRPVTIEIPSAYNNHTLPDLRAQFIKDAILQPFLRECVNEQIPVKILKGHTFASLDNPLQRKVDVYVSLY